MAGTLGLGDNVGGKFQEISDGQLSKLQLAIEQKLPITTQMLNILLLKMQGRFTCDTLVSFFVYSDEESAADCWENPFILCCQQPNMHGVYCILLHAPSSITQPMIEALDAFVDWKKSPIFPAVPQAFYDAHLKALCLKHGGPPKEHPCEAYAMKIESAASFSKEYIYINGGDLIEIRPLDENDVDQALATDLNRLWMHPKSKQQMHLAIGNLATMGAYVSKDLAAFGMLSPVGLMNNVWTEAPFRRRGLALAVLQSLCRSVADLACTPMAECTVQNDSSRQLLCKSGFDFVQKTNWVTFKPAL